MMKKGNDLRKVITKELSEKWVALSASNQKKVIASSNNLIDLTKIVGTKKAIYIKTPPADTYFAF